MARSGVAIGGSVGLSWLVIIGLVVGICWWKKSH